MVPMNLLYLAIGVMYLAVATMYASINHYVIAAIWAAGGVVWWIAAGIMR